MRKNIGRPDRAIRIIIGALLCLLSAMKVIGPWGYIGVVLAMSGVIGYCVAYQCAGFSTCPYVPEEELEEE
ncbi:YgaP family membrane protein [Spirabiliibacterium falconis]|uniref:YgaP family membrane protein n=1 Tax=Spirabiliibacterium falconis TaxID=572023 RepID=UPI001AADAE4D|nr:DUF2892 domain-containing protein [Spirabiliibacterium falconis]MBE2894966.1 DUF2892 domain-containing protein [Spirabiliibacterium falconis]